MGARHVIDAPVGESVENVVDVRVDSIKESPLKRRLDAPPEDRDALRPVTVMVPPLLCDIVLAEVIDTVEVSDEMAMAEGT